MSKIFMLYAKGESLHMDTGSGWLRYQFSHCSPGKNLALMLTIYALQCMKCRLAEVHVLTSLLSVGHQHKIERSPRRLPTN